MLHSNFFNFYVYFLTQNEINFVYLPDSILIAIGYQTYTILVNSCKKCNASPN